MIARFGSCHQRKQQDEPHAPLVESNRLQASQSRQFRSALCSPSVWASIGPHLVATPRLVNCKSCSRQKKLHWRLPGLLPLLLSVVTLVACSGTVGLEDAVAGAFEPPLTEASAGVLLAYAAPGCRLVKRSRRDRFSSPLQEQAPPDDRCLPSFVCRSFVACLSSGGFVSVARCWPLLLV